MPFLVRPMRDFLVAGQTFLVPLLTNQQNWERMGAVLQGAHEGRLVRDDASADRGFPLR